MPEAEHSLWGIHTGAFDSIRCQTDQEAPAFLRGIRRRLRHSATLPRKTRDLPVRRPGGPVIVGHAHDLHIVEKDRGIAA
jgi:hypothetical protein